MRKGFMHIVEIVVISLLVIVLMAQLYRTYPAQSAWSKAQLKALAEDILHSLRAKGTNWTNTAHVEAELIQLLGRTNTVFDLEIQNLVKPDVWVGCVCTDSEYSELSGLMAGQAGEFALNGMGYRIRMERISHTQPDFPLIYDVIIIGRSPELLTGYKHLMEKYLLAGRGIIEIRDLDAEYKLEETQNELFGLKWEQAGQDRGDPTYRIIFNTPPESRYYNIRKYFMAIPNMTGNPDSLDDFVNETFAFSNFVGSNEEVWVTDNDDKRVILFIKDFVPMAPALVVKDKAYKGRGRAAWLSAGYGGGELEEKGVLIKSLILWASGEVFHVTGHEIKEPEVSYLIDVIRRRRELEPVEQRRTFFHPVKVVLSLGYVLK